MNWIAPLTRVREAAVTNSIGDNKNEPCAHKNLVVRAEIQPGGCECPRDRVADVDLL